MAWFSFFLSHLSSFNFELVVDARREVVQHDHLGLRPESVLLLDAHADQRLDGRAARDAAHRGNGAGEAVIVESCKRREGLTTDWQT